MGEAIIDHQSSINNSSIDQTLEFWSHDIVTRTPVFSRIHPAEYDYGPYNSGRQRYLLWRRRYGYGVQP
jgi:hypothetical protein